MFQQYYEPHPALKGFVNNIIIDHIQFEAKQHCPVFTIPPLPEHCLMFYLKDASIAEDVSAATCETLSGAVVIGPNINRHNIMPGTDHLMIKVGFQPGGLYRFLGIPMKELRCQDTFNAADLLGNSIYTLIRQLQETVCYSNMKTLIEHFLMCYINKLKEPLPIDAILPLIIQGRGLIKIDQLASEACLSIRQFERVFQQRIGLPPKHFSRLVRFGQAWIMKQQQPAASWINIAHASGYFDQMHLIRDFQEFAGVNPTVIEQELMHSPIKNFTRLFH